MSYKNKLEQREYQRQFVANRRFEYFNGKKCSNCPSKINLELHHRDRKDKISHRIWSWSKEKREAELSKCDILCIDCHKDRTKNQLEQIKHGITMYNKGCRCKVCVFSNRKRKNRNRHKLS